MRNTMKMAAVALAFLALIPTTATAQNIYAPHPGTVPALTYSASGSFHGAVDISSGRCNYWGVESPIRGSIFWNVTINTTGIVCYGSGSGNQNEAKHNFADGWTFRIWHFIKTANSYDRTCDRCLLGNEGATGNVTGPVTHFHYDHLGTKDTSWYSGYTVEGETIDFGELVGVL